MYFTYYYMQYSGEEWNMIYRIYVLLMLFFEAVATWVFGFTVSIMICTCITLFLLFPSIVKFVVLQVTPGTLGDHIDLPHFLGGVIPNTL